MQHSGHLLLLLPWVLFAILLSIILFSSSCVLEEKRALLEFKSSILIYQRAHFGLPTWSSDDGDDDCCKWEGVKCSDETGRMIELQLNDIVRDLVENILNITIFLPLKNLRSLDLSGNGFVSDMAGCERLPTFENLEYLSLGYNNFNRSILKCITAFPNLKHLSLTASGLLDLFPYEEFNQLKQLEHLDLSFTVFSGSLSFKEMKLKNLKVLKLTSTHFSQLSSIEVMTSLKALSLSYNSLNDSSIFEGICSLKNLIELDLSWNGFGGNLPQCLRKLTSLRFLDISQNNFSGNIPSLVISSLIHLEYLSLTSNQFEGSFSFGSFVNHSNLQFLLLGSLENGLYVDFKGPTLPLYVDFEGLPLPPPFQLRVLYLSGCNLNNDTRNFQNFLFYQNELRALDLSSNNLVGEIPLWLLKNNTSLEILDLRNNRFSGSFLVNGAPKPNMTKLDISNNEVGGLVPQDIGSFFPKLKYLNLSGNSFEGSIPDSLGNLTVAIMIDLSHNKFAGEVPYRIETGCVSLWRLIVSNNNLQGYFPSNSMNLTSLDSLYLDNNHFSGSIPHGLSRSPRLGSLKISKNEYHGTIPGWIGNFSKLYILDLSHNALEGTIPDDICKPTKLSFLDLSDNLFNGSVPECSNNSILRFIHLQNNQITGSIPNTLMNNSELVTIDLRHNHLSGIIPRGIRRLRRLRVLLLGGNNLQGQIPEYVCPLKDLSIMDLSQNNFSGQIPSCFSNISFGRWHLADDAFGPLFQGMWGHLSAYNFNSSLEPDWMPSDVIIISYVQEEVQFMTKSRMNTYASNILNYMSGLDLSCNKLTGEIPPELGDISGLRALNLSHNNFKGSIPSRLSMLNQIESLDLSCNNLSGEIPFQLENLNFLSIFNVSYNNLSGRVPEARQFANFDENNYRGNPNLCGSLLKRRCNNVTTDPGHAVGGDGEETDGTIDMVTFFWSFSAGFVSAVLAYALSLYVNPRFRRTWFGIIDEWILSIFYHRRNTYIRPPAFLAKQIIRKAK